MKYPAFIFPYLTRPFFSIYEQSAEKHADQYILLITITANEPATKQTGTFFHAIIK